MKRAWQVIALIGIIVLLNSVSAYAGVFEPYTRSGTYPFQSDLWRGGIDWSDPGPSTTRSAYGGTGWVAYGYAAANFIGGMPTLKANGYNSGGGQAQATDQLTVNLPAGYTGDRDVTLNLLLSGQLSVYFPGWNNDLGQSRVYVGAYLPGVAPAVGAGYEVFMQGWPGYPGGTIEVGTQGSSGTWTYTSGGYSVTPTYFTAAKTYGVARTNVNRVVNLTLVDVPEGTSEYILSLAAVTGSDGSNPMGWGGYGSNIKSNFSSTLGYDPDFPIGLDDNGNIIPLPVGSSFQVGANAPYLEVLGFSNGVYSTRDYVPTTGGGVIPEPATMLLFGVGGLGLAAVRRRRKGKADYTDLGEITQIEKKSF